MDIVRERKNHHWLKRKPILVVGFLALLAAIKFGISGASSSNLSVSEKSVLMAEVKRGNMEVKASGNGFLVPDTIQWLSSRVSGRVETVYVKAGASVRNGDPLVKLTNPELNQLAEETRWSYEAQLASLNALKESLESQKLNNQAKVVRAKFAYDSAKLQLKAETRLMEEAEGVISAVDFQKTQLNVSQLEQGWKIEQQIAEKFEENARAQIVAKEAEVKRLNNMLTRAEDQVASLLIRSTMDGIVQESSLEQGQQVNTGSNVAKVADPNSLIAEIQVPELLAADVTIGQAVVVDTRSGHIDGVVSRVNPAVVNGNVQVDVKLVGEMTANARPDLSVMAEITTAKLTNTLYVSRPTYAQANRNNVLYAVNESGYANKTPVSLGKASGNQIQILSGLNLGDKVVVSDTSDWLNHQSVNIN